MGYFLLPKKGVNIKMEQGILEKGKQVYDLIKDMDYKNQLLVLAIVQILRFDNCKKADDYSYWDLNVLFK